MKKAIWTLLLLLMISGLGWSKQPQDNWDNLKQLTPGQKVEVVDSKIKTLKGTFVAVSDEAISLQVGKSEQSVARADVVRVSVRDTSHRARNMLLASGIIGGVALAASIVPLASSGNEGNSCPACAGAIAAGFGGGAALGAIPGNRTLYRAKK